MKGDEVPHLQAAKLALGILRSVEFAGLPYLALVKDLHRELPLEWQRKLHLLHGGVTCQSLLQMSHSDSEKTKWKPGPRHGPVLEHQDWER